MAIKDLYTLNLPLLAYHEKNNYYHKSQSWLRMHWSAIGCFSGLSKWTSEIHETLQNQNISLRMPGFFPEYSWSNVSVFPGKNYRCSCWNCLKTVLLLGDTNRTLKFCFCSEMQKFLWTGKKKRKENSSGLWI